MNDNCPLHPTVPCDCVPRYYRSAPAQREPQQTPMTFEEVAKYHYAEVCGDPACIPCGCFEHGWHARDSELAAKDEEIGKLAVQNERLMQKSADTIAALQQQLRDEQRQNKTLRILAEKNGRGLGTPSARLTMLAKFAEEEFGHSPVSCRAFEGTIYEGVARLKSDLAAAQKRIAAIRAFVEAQHAGCNRYNCDTLREIERLAKAEDER